MLLLALASVSPQRLALPASAARVAAPRRVSMTVVKFCYLGFLERAERARDAERDVLY